MTGLSDTICDGRSKCKLRRLAAKRDPFFDIRPIDAADTDNHAARMRSKMVTPAAWFGPITFCPFCGRYVSYNARFSALLSGKIPTERAKLKAVSTEDLKREIERRAKLKPTEPKP